MDVSGKEQHAAEAASEANPHYPGFRFNVNHESQFSIHLLHLRRTILRAEHPSGGIPGQWVLQKTRAQIALVINDYVISKIAQANVYNHTFKMTPARDPKQRRKAKPKPYRKNVPKEHPCGAIHESNLGEQSRGAIWESNPGELSQRQDPRFELPSAHVYSIL
jgi:hypothetical protein